MKTDLNFDKNDIPYDLPGDNEYVIVEVMPDHLRGSHRAARNWGQYPFNGAERQRMNRTEAEELVRNDEDRYNHIMDK